MTRIDYSALPLSSNVQAARAADTEFFAANADWNRRVVPLITTRRQVTKNLEAILPERGDICGPRIKVAQIKRRELPQLFDRVCQGGVHYGVVQRGDEPADQAQLSPLSPALMVNPPERLISITDFRRTVDQLLSAPLPDSPLYIVREGREIVAVLERPRMINSASREPWYAHLPVEHFISTPNYNSEHSKAIDRDPDVRRINADLSQPVYPVSFGAALLDGPWRHQHQIAILNWSSRDHFLYSYSLAQLQKCPADQLLDRIAFVGGKVHLLNDERTAFLGSLGSLDRKLLPFIAPENTISAEELWADLYRLLENDGVKRHQGNSERSFFLRREDWFLAKLSIDKEPRPIATELQKWLIDHTNPDL